MINANDLVLIISHPDDECLFASSLLKKISTLIICFRDIPNNYEISNARKKALNSYPLKKIKVLELKISQAKETLIPINWLNIKDSRTGLKGGYKNKSYNTNFEKLLFKLRDLVPNNSSLVTHNPWGEYGHSEHSQVFKACFQISIERESNLYVSGYISNLSKHYALRKLHLLFPKVYKFKTNKKIFNLLRDHYIKKGCWTWYYSYDIPKMEFFYKVNLSKDVNSISSKNISFNLPFNYIKHINPLSYFVIGIIKKFFPFYIKKILRKIHLLNK